MRSLNKQGKEKLFTLLNSGDDHVEEGERKIYIPDGSCYKFTCKADLNSDLTVANLKEKLKLELDGGCIYSLFAAGVEDALGDAVQVICITDALFAMPGELSPLEQYNHDPEAYLRKFVYPIKDEVVRELPALTSKYKSHLKILWAEAARVDDRSSCLLLIQLSNIMGSKEFFDYMLVIILGSSPYNHLSIRSNMSCPISGYCFDLDGCSGLLAIIAYTQIETLCFIMQEYKSIYDLPARGHRRELNYSSVLYKLLRIGDYIRGDIDLQKFDVALTKLIDNGAIVPMIFEVEEDGRYALPEKAIEALFRFNSTMTLANRVKFNVIQSYRLISEKAITDYISGEVRKNPKIIEDANRILKQARAKFFSSLRGQDMMDQIFTASGSGSCYSPLVTAYLVIKKGFVGGLSIAETNTLRQLNKDFPNSQAQDGAGQGAGGASSLGLWSSSEELETGAGAGSGDGRGCLVS